jgi:hypothetical protein
MIDRRHLHGAVLLLAVWPVWGQEEGAPASAERETPPPAELRAWIFPGGSTDSCAIVMRRPRQDEPEPLVDSQDGRQVLDLAYGPQAAGGVIFELRDPNQRVLASAKAVLRPRGHYTLLAARTGEGWQLQALEDAAPPNAPDRALRVVNLTRGRETVLTFSAEKQEKVPGDAFKEFRLPARVNGFSVQVLSPDGGPPAQTSAEVDLDEYPAAYVVITPDRRERLIPEIIEAGAAKTQPPPLPTVAMQFDPVEERRKERESRRLSLRLERDHLAAEVAILKAQIREGVNVPEGAEDLQQEMEKQIRSVQTRIDQAGNATATPAPAAPR